MGCAGRFCPWGYSRNLWMCEGPGHWEIVVIDKCMVGLDYLRDDPTLDIFQP